MHIAKNDIPVQIDTPGAVARQHRASSETSAASGLEYFEYFSMAKGTDLTPLLEGLEGDLCQAAHWGYVIEGDLVVTYADGETERCTAGDLFHWPGGHTVRVDQDAELILFSEAEHGAVVDHIAGKVAASTS